MARDYTKYNVEGLDENLNKRQLVFTVVKDYVEKNNPSFEDSKKIPVTIKKTDDNILTQFETLL